MRRFRSLLVVAVGSLSLLAPLPAGAASGWAIAPTPNPAGSISSLLSGVSCPSLNSCMAVGSYYTSGSHLLTLAERWNGSTWTVTPTPNPTSAQAVLLGVSCPAAYDCEAVGYSVKNSTVRALAEHWNGAVWRTLLLPRPAVSNWQALFSVSCTAPNACIAVGGFINSAIIAQEQPLSERWDGTDWHLLPTPDPMAENGSDLGGISCFAASSCEAVGNYAYGDVDQSIFAFGWNGSAWHQQGQPNPHGQFLNTNNGVACAAASECMSVGTWQDRVGNVVPLSESWNGATWTRLKTPAPAGAQHTNLFGVSCPATSTCISVGDSANNLNGLPSASLAELWNGTDWDITPTPNPAGAQATSLRGVSCPQSNACVAVGSWYASGVSYTVAEVYTG